MWVSRAAGWRGWLGGFLQVVLYSLQHIIQALAHQLVEERAPHKSGMEMLDLHHPSVLISKHFAWLCFGKTSPNLVSNPSFCSYCPVSHEECSKMNGKMNCRHFPPMLCSSVFSCTIQTTGIILCTCTSFIRCCYSLVFLLTLPWATCRIAR